MKPYLNKEKENKVIAIVAAAGRGERLKSNKPKTLILIKNKPILFFSLYSLSLHSLVDEIILVSSPDTLEHARRLVKREKFNKVKHITTGGATRKESVACGLKYIQAKKDIFVLIHDAARPFINKSLLTNLIKNAFKFNAVISAVPIKSTLKMARSKKINPLVKKTLNRDSLWEVHTPQIFRADLLKKAFSRFKTLAVTDDAALLERLGVAVRIINGSCSNIKITTPEDLIFARAISRKFKWTN